MAWDEVVADVMPIELTLHQMPHDLAIHNRTHYRVEYRPIGDPSSCERFLVIVTDVTVDVEREHAEREAREGIAVFQRVLVDRSGFEAFFDEGAIVLDRLVNDRTADLAAVRRLVHTLKGNSSLFGLQSIASMCHELEDHIEREARIPRPEAIGALKERWGRLSSDVRTLLGNRGNKIEVDEKQYAAIEAAVRAGEPHVALIRRVRSLKLESAANRLHHFQEQAHRIAERLEKPSVQVEVADGGVRLDARRWAGFWGSFIHAIRNAVDHGIEMPEARVAAGKSPEGRVALRAYEESDRIVVEIADDGRGIDWDALADRARTLGLPAQTRADLHAALFAEGVSTAASVTEVSGRGIGMSALLEGTRALGGNVIVDSIPGKGTTLRFTFPASAGRSVESLIPAAAMN